MAEIFKSYINPALNCFDSETLHSQVVNGLHFLESNPVTLKALETIVQKEKRIGDIRLEVRIENIKFDNPFAVAAGWTKNGLALKSLYALGFSAIEVGTVTEKPQPGNPKPRQFMITEDVAINSLGFNSEGMDKVAENLERYKERKFPIGISIGKNKDIKLENVPETYATLFEKLQDYGDYFVIAISSPNTEGLRKLQEKKPLAEILKAILVVKKRIGCDKPIFIKVAPDLTIYELDDVIEVALENGASGIIATNTTDNLYVKEIYGEKWRDMSGGLSGNNKYLQERSLLFTAHIYRETNDKLVVMCSGGINSSNALKWSKAGGKLFQVNTALRYEALTTAIKGNQNIIAFMNQENINSLEEIRGSEANKYK